MPQEGAELQKSPKLEKIVNRNYDYIEYLGRAFRVPAGDFLLQFKRDDKIRRYENIVTKQLEVKPYSPISCQCSECKYLSVYGRILAEKGKIAKKTMANQCEYDYIKHPPKGEFVHLVHDIGLDSSGRFTEYAVRNYSCPVLIAYMISVIRAGHADGCSIPLLIHNSKEFPFSYAVEEEINSNLLNNKNALDSKKKNPFLKAIELYHKMPFTDGGGHFFDKNMDPIKG